MRRWVPVLFCAAAPLLLLLLRHDVKVLPESLAKRSIFWSYWLRSHTQRGREVCLDPYDPHHHVPTITPWFEGWYTRASLSDASVAFAIGAFQDRPAAPLHPLREEPGTSACFVIVDTGAGSLSHLHLPRAAVEVTRTQDPTRPSFQAIATQQAEPGSMSDPPGGYCNLTVDSGHVFIQFFLPGELLLEISSEGTASAWMPWSSAPHSSPEAYVGRLLDLHYHVYSLATPAQVALHWLSDPQQRQQRRRQAPPEGGAGALAPPPRTAARDFAGPALVHMEKNWGSGFPSSWIWAQGHLKQPQQGFLQEKVAFVLAGGSISSPLPSVLPDLYLYVLSIRSTCQQDPGSTARTADPGSTARTACTPLDVQVDPWDPALMFKEQVSSCQGSVALKLFNSFHIIEANLSAPPATFTPLPCPNRSGSFQDAGSVESFQATATFRVWTRPFPFAPESLCTLAAEVSFSDAALEFGGAHMCGEISV